KLADHLGFLVIHEAFDECQTGKNKWIAAWNVAKPGKDGYHEYFKDWADEDLKDMMLRNRNRPSIIMWSIGNEVDYPNDPYSDPILNTGRNPQIYGKGYLSDHPGAKRLGELSKQLVKVAKDVDTTRPITAALAGVVMSNTTSYPENLDIVGYNYQEYRYQEDHKEFPKRVIYGSENGLSLDAWLAVEDNSFISGQFLWTGIDYLGEANKWPSRSSGAGLLDLAGNPKPIFYFRKSLWTSKPTISLAVTDAPVDSTKPKLNYGKLKASWNWATGKTVQVASFTNCSTAELFLNGKSLGKKSQTPEKIIFWDILYQPGELVVRGFHDGEIVADTLRSSGKATQIRTHFYKSKLQKSTKMAQIELQLVDEKGIAVGDDDREVSIIVSGAGKLAGLESGSSTSHEDYKSNKRTTLNGKLLIFVQSAQKAGLIKVTLTSAGLPTKTINYDQ
ncbi:MAG: glycoside hydrolase family 2 protein, partial [Pedobacter sp.]|nr:glycoside hydrolase family 2 protein [Pedobacter sp.]